MKNMHNNVGVNQTNGKLQRLYQEGFYKKIIALRNELRNYFSSIHHVDSEQ